MTNNERDDDKREESDGDPPTDTFREAIIHGSGLGFHHNDTEIYDNTRNLWYDEVGEAGEKSVVTSYTPDFSDETYHFFLVSSRWKAGTGKGDDFTSYYEYIIYARILEEGEYKLPTRRLKLTIQPQLNDLVYKDGNDLELPHGEGTRIKIETTYADTPGEVVRRAQRLLTEILDEDYDPEGIEWDTGNITKLETHFRYDREMMDTAVTSLMNTERLISWMGRSVIKGGETRRREPGWDIYKFGSGAWDRLGFTDLGNYILGLKTYSMSNWDQYPPEHPLYHPKIEAFYMGKKSAETQPHVDDWDELTEVLRHITTMHAHNWIGLDRDDLVADDFFQGSDAPSYEYECLEGRRDDLRSMHEDTQTTIMKEAMRSKSDVPYELLAAMRDHPKGVPFKTLRERLDVSQRTIRTHAKRMEDSGFVERVGNPGELRYISPAVHEQAEETLRELHPDETASDQRERRENAKSDDSDDSSEDRDQNDRQPFQYLNDQLSYEEMERAREIGLLDDGDIRHRRIPDEQLRRIQAAMNVHVSSDDD